MRDRGADTFARATHRCLPVGRGRLSRGPPLFGRRHAVAADHDQNGADGDDRSFLDEDPRHDARGGRRDLHRRFVRLDLDERLVLRNLLALGHEPARDLAFGQSLTEVRQLELERHCS